MIKVFNLLIPYFLFEGKMETYNEVTNEEITEALKICNEVGSEKGIRVLWSLFKDVEGDEEFETIRERIKKGYKIKFDIRKITDGEYVMYPDSNHVKIRGYRLKVDEDDFKDELEEREKGMKEILREMYDYGNQGEIKIRGHDDS